MRLIFCIIILIFLTGCQHRADKKNSNVILAYINSNVEQNKFDIRIYNPPSPPDSMNTSIRGGSIKHDSIIAKLTPLHLYISDSITFDDNFLYRQRDSINEFFFLKDAINSKKKSIYLNLNILKNRKSIVLESIHTDKFFELYPNIRFNNDYGGMLSFQNLFISKDGKKAYFEVIYFKNRLNAQKSAIYAEFKNSKWIFKSEIISIS